MHKEVAKMSTRELEEYISSGHLTPLAVAAATKELRRRYLRPHWSVSPTFWISLVTLIILIIAHLQELKALFQ